MVICKFFLGGGEGGEFLNLNLLKVMINMGAFIKKKEVHESRVRGTGTRF